MVGPYRIVREIGRGGMGSVYLAVRADDQYRMEVAIKMVATGRDHSRLIRRFLRERQILANLEHPHIARLLDGGVTDRGVPYLVMEYVTGRRLDRYCADERLTVQERLRLFEDVCRAVHYAHTQLVVHRDLKPGNVLVTDHGSVKLLDFGIAKLLDPEPDSDGDTMTRAGGRVLTPEYASPEHLQGDPVGTASDVYSLGVLLYELLVGRRPFESLDSMRELERAVCSETHRVRVERWMTIPSRNSWRGIAPPLPPGFDGASPETSTTSFFRRFARSPSAATRPRARWWMTLNVTSRVSLSGPDPTRSGTGAGSLFDDTGWSLRPARWDSPPSSPDSPAPRGKRAARRSRPPKQTRSASSSSGCSRLRTHPRVVERASRSASYSTGALSVPGPSSRTSARCRPKCWASWATLTASSVCMKRPMNWSEKGSPSTGAIRPGRSPGGGEPQPAGQRPAG